MDPQTPAYKALIKQILTTKEVEVLGQKQIQQTLKLVILEGPDKGKEIIIQTGGSGTKSVANYSSNDKVLISTLSTPQGNRYFIADFARTEPLFWLFSLFLIVTLLVTRFKGLRSFAGLFGSFLIIFGFLLPQILSGQNPLTVSILAAIFIVPVSFYLTHGFNKKSTAAVLGTIFALIITGILALIFIGLGKLTGLASEEAAFLQVLQKGNVDLRGLLLAGIIIGSLGVLDDITVSQASVVQQLKAVSDRLKVREVYSKAMKVGSDHIASMVNTLILVYTGAALPLLLLFLGTNQQYTKILNYEIIAEEVIRTLVASIGLVLAVPITTLIAALLYRD